MSLLDHLSGQRQTETEAQTFTFTSEDAETTHQSHQWMSSGTVWDFCSYFSREHGDQSRYFEPNHDVFLSPTKWFLCLNLTSSQTQQSARKKST